MDIDCIRGDTTAWDLAVVKNGTPVDLTEAKLWMTARRNVGGDILFQRTSDSDMGIIIDPDQVNNRGDAIITLGQDSTSSLQAEPVILFYDIQCKVGDNIWTVTSGSLTVSPDATTDDE